MKSSKGITLIALIITVIVMLILAAVAINLTIGDNGIFRKSDEGAQIYKNAANNETVSLNSAEQEMGNLIEQYGSSKKMINFTMKLKLSNYGTTEKTYNLQAYEGETWGQWYERMKDSEIYAEINEDSETCFDSCFGAGSPWHSYYPDELRGYYESSAVNMSTELKENDRICSGDDVILPTVEYLLDVNLG